MEDLKYIDFSKKILENINSQNGFIEIESYREKSRKGVTISYWKSIPAIQEWSEYSTHLKTQKYSRDLAYSNYTVKIYEVQREYNLKRTDVKYKNS